MFSLSLCSLFLHFPGCRPSLTLDGAEDNRAGERGALVPTLHSCVDTTVMQALVSDPTLSLGG